jgi:hypothetical protein
VNKAIRPLMVLCSTLLKTKTRIKTKTTKQEKGKKSKGTPREYYAKICPKPKNIYKL